MKTHLPALACLIFSFSAMAQTGVLQNNTISCTQQAQLKNISRTQEFKEIAFFHQTSTDGISFTPADSSNQFTYDANGNLVSELIQKWNGTAWVNSTYDSTQYVNGIKVLFLSFSWDAGHNAWANNYKISYVYDTLNYLTGDTTSTWNSGATSWNYEYANSIVNDSIGQATYWLTLKWTNTGWDSIFQSTLNYDVYGDQISTYTSALDSATDTWSPFAYDTSTFQPINILISYLHSVWNTDSNSYFPLNGRTYGYDELGNNTSEFFYTYNDTVATNTDQWFFYYADINFTGVHTVSANTGITLFPNPASNFLTFQLNGLSADELRLYDLSGQLITGISSPQNNVVDVSQLSPGVYVAEVVVNSTTSRLKWIKM